MFEVFGNFKFLKDLSSFTVFVDLSRQFLENFLVGFGDLFRSFRGTFGHFVENV